ncbi:hypothetical protein [Ideonella oryzae]|uniref:Uncharacterized protein n=1 Tax=Ideonella oryzae TaxID=2937441 RepID=A0ABT1BT16_9BURK|nr:hypothetical protein [Ideonella oryzae]MCO5979368.1 hypothetical protein [Ideonella oryzae]
MVPGVDAILDVLIDGAGYYPGKQVGYVPYLSVTARLLEAKDPSEAIDDFDYEVGYGDAKGDPRFFNSPTLLVKTLDVFRDQAPSITQELTTVYQTVAKQIGNDINRAIRKLPRVSAPTGAAAQPVTAADALRQGSPARARG